MNWEFGNLGMDPYVVVHSIDTWLDPATLTECFVAPDPSLGSLDRW